MYIKYMQGRFASNPKKIKILKKLGSRMRVGRKALDCFNDLCASMEAVDDPFLKLDPIYAFLNNGRKVLGSGKPLSECFVGWMSPEQIVLIKTGEETGKVSDAIKNCIELESQVTLIRKTIKKSAFTPIFALVMLMVVLVGTYQKGIPLLSEILPLEEWEGMALQLYDMTYTFGADPIKTVVIFIACVGAFAWSIPNLDIPSMPSLRKGLDKYMPFFGIYRVMQASIFLRSLSTLLSAGVRIKVAFDLIVENSNPYVSNRVSMMRDQIAKGEDLAECFKNDFLGENGQDLADMAQGDSLEEALEEVATETMAEILETLPVKLMLVGKALIGVCLMVIMFAMGAFYEIVGSVT